MHSHNSHCTRGMSLEDRLLHFIPEQPESCWPWTGATNYAGYGVLNVGKTQYRAHRVAYELWVGPIGPGLTIDHVRARGCVSRSCCNPAHLEAVTGSENVRRGNSPPMIMSRKDTCIRGHAFAGDNLGTRRVGDKIYRLCRTCARIRGRKHDRLRRRSHSSSS